MRARFLAAWLFGCLMLPFTALTVGPRDAAFAALAICLLGLVGLVAFILATSRAFTRRYGVLCPGCGNNLGAIYGPYSYGTGPFYSTQCMRCKTEMEIA